jgi:hypothetical protein
MPVVNWACSQVIPQAQHTARVVSNRHIVLNDKLSTAFTRRVTGASKTRRQPNGYAADFQTTKHTTFHNVTHTISTYPFAIVGYALGATVGPGPLLGCGVGACAANVGAAVGAAPNPIRAPLKPAKSTDPRPVTGSHPGSAE